MIHRHWDFLTISSVPFVRQQYLPKSIIGSVEYQHEDLNDKSLNRQLQICFYLFFKYNVVNEIECSQSFYNTPEEAFSDGFSVWVIIPKVTMLWRFSNILVDNIQAVNI